MVLIDCECFVGVFDEGGDVGVEEVFFFVEIDYEWGVVVCVDYEFWVVLVYGE